MAEEWCIHVKSFGDVRVANKLISELLSYRQLTSNQPESGGTLIGKHLNSGGVMLIDEFTPPQHNDQCARASYFRSYDHNALVKKRWEETSGYSTLVGLWHTHPEAVPRYSSIDKQDWLLALDKCVYEGERLFFFIVGQSSICCWVGVKSYFRKKIQFVGEYKIEK